jgi:hypothetical protein
MLQQWQNQPAIKQLYLVIETLYVLVTFTAQRIEFGV